MKKKGLLGLIISTIALIIGGINSSFADWKTDLDVIGSTSTDLVPDTTFPVAYSGSTYYSTIDAALLDNSSTSANATKTATIYVIPTDEIISKNGLSRTEAVFNAINRAKTLTQSVVLGTNKTLSLPYSGTSTLTIDQSKTGTEYGDSSVANIGTNLKNNISIDENVSLTIPYSSTLTIGAILSQTNSALITSAVFSNYSQITLRKNASITVNGTLQAYGYIKETYDAQQTTNVYLTGSNGKTATMSCPLNIHQTIGGSATSSCGSSNVWPYNIYTISSINSTLHLNYYSSVSVTAYVMVSSSRYSPSTTLVSSSAGMFILKEQNSSLKWYHTQNNYIKATELVRKDSSGNVINILERVSTTSINNYQRKTYVDIYGPTSIGRISLRIVITVDTNSYYLPLSYEYQISIKEGGSLTNDYRICFLPGSSVTVEQGATLTLNNHTLFMTKRKNDAGYILAAVGASNGVQKYPVINKNEDSLAEIDCEYDNAKLYNAGSVYINKGFGGKIYATAETCAQGNNSFITFGSNYLNIGESTATNSSTCPRFYSTTSALSTFGYYQSNAYFKLNTGSSMDYLVPTPGTYVGFKKEVSQNIFEYGWTANSAVIKYNTNGSSDTYADKQISITSSGYVISENDLPATEPTRQYYTFEGWYLNGDMSKPVDSNHTYVTYVGVTLVAKWNTIDYDIVYHCDLDHNGSPISGTYTNDNPTTVNGESNFALNTPIYEVENVYVFDGWYLNSNYTDKISIINSSSLSKLDFNNQLHLYGRWYPSDVSVWTITYITNNSDPQISCIESEDIISANIANLTTPDLSANNNNLQYDKYFEGWYLDSELQTKYTSYTQIEGDTILYGKWLTKSKINLALLGNVIGVRYLNKDATFTIPDLATTYPDISLDERTGYDLRWLVSGGPLSGGVYNTGDRITLTDDWGQEITVNYDYVAKEFTLTVKVGGYQKTTVTVNGDSSRSITINHSSSSTTSTDTSLKVKTGDTITVTITRDSGYTEGGTVSKTYLNGSGPYTVSGEGAPTITVADCSKPASCLLPETLITMADGSKKEVQYIESGDMIQVFNHETGKIDIVPVIFNEKEEAELVNVINLNFSNGAYIGVVSEHGFFDLDTLRYEYIRENNFTDYIGHHFYDESGEIVVLENAYISQKVTEVYSPVSYFHLNLFTEGILSMPGNCDGFINIFEVDSTLQYNQESYYKDIETYGLCTYEDLIEYGITEDIFNAYAGMYIYIAMGKGVLTEERLMYLMERYALLYEQLL